MRNFFLSKSQTRSTMGNAMDRRSRTNSEFSFDRNEVSFIYSLTVKMAIIIIATNDIQVVIHGIASLQLMALKTKTYHQIVKNNGIR